ncbi:hypothetical protein BAY68_10010 [Bacillus pumilus]|nr:hypothetical protein BAY68_10010 [Bacillus pumilus]
MRETWNKRSFRILGDFFYDRFYGFEQFLVIMKKIDKFSAKFNQIFIKGFCQSLANDVYSTLIFILWIFNLSARIYRCNISIMIKEMNN